MAALLPALRRRLLPMPNPASNIVVEGNRRVEVETIRSYFQPGSRRPPRCGADRSGPEGPLRHRSVPGRAHPPGRRQDHRDGGRERGHQSHRLRRQQEGQGRAVDERGAVAGARHILASAGAGRYAAPRRNLSPLRPLRRDGDAENHRAAEQSRRSRVRDQRRRQDRRHENPFCRQPDLRRSAPQGRHQDQRIQFPELPEEHRHL